MVWDLQYLINKLHEHRLNQIKFGWADNNFQHHNVTYRVTDPDILYEQGDQYLLSGACWAGVFVPVTNRPELKDQFPLMILPPAGPEWKHDNGEFWEWWCDDPNNPWYEIRPDYFDSKVGALWRDIRKYDLNLLYLMLRVARFPFEHYATIQGWEKIRREAPNFQPWLAAWFGHYSETGIETHGHAIPWSCITNFTKKAYENFSGGFKGGKIETVSPYLYKMTTALPPVANAFFGHDDGLIFNKVEKTSGSTRGRRFGLLKSTPQNQKPSVKNISWQDTFKRIQDDNQIKLEA